MSADEMLAGDASKIIGCDQSTVYRYIKSKWIPNEKRGRHYFVKKTVPMKVKTALDLGGPDMVQKIQWEPQDLYEFRKQLELTESAAPIADQTPVAKELGSMAKRLEQMGESNLARAVMSRAIDFM